MASVLNGMVYGVLEIRWGVYYQVFVGGIGGIAWNIDFSCVHIILILNNFECTLNSTKIAKPSINRSLTLISSAILMALREIKMCSFCCQVPGIAKAPTHTGIKIKLRAWQYCQFYLSPFLLQSRCDVPFCRGLSYTFQLLGLRLFLLFPDEEAGPRKIFLCIFYLPGLPCMTPIRARGPEVGAQDAEATAIGGAAPWPAFNVRHFICHKTDTRHH